MPSASPPSSPTLFLVDGYALIYRAFFALLSRPLTTSRGENTSAAWGVVNFLQRLVAKHKPDYIGWVHDSGRTFRHEVYPAYKATREKLTDELQADFDTGLDRIRQLLEAFQIPVLAIDGFEADDVIGQASLLWKMIYRSVHTTLRHTQGDARSLNPDLQVVRHEDFSRDPLNKYRDLYSTLGLDFSKRVEKVILNSSSSENPTELSLKKTHSVKLDSAANIKNWKKRLSAEELGRIREITGEVADLYYSNEEWE